MKFTVLTLLSVLTASTATADEYESLFNGRDLTGWNGSSELWSVEDGAITGRTNGPETLKANQFLIWKGGKVRDFELKADFRLEGKNNSGVQYRSRPLPDIGPHVVGGYQADIHSRPEYTGMLYEEKGRGILANRGQRVRIDKNGKKTVEKLDIDVKALDLTEWHELTIVARGRKVIHMLDGEVVMELTDQQAKPDQLSGLIALQVHRGPAMKAQFKNIRLKKLAGPRKAGPKKSASKSVPRPGAVKPSWIWSLKNGEPASDVYFRKEFEIRGAVAAAHLYLAVDNEATVYLDGKKVLEHGGWDKPAFKNITSMLGKETPGGRHVLAIRARNVGENNPAGLLAQLNFESGWRDAWSYVSDDSWQVTTEPHEGWMEPAFSAKNWKKPDVIAALGGGPWKSVNEKTLAAVAPLREPTATAIDSLKVHKDFNVELLYSVPKDVEGSWVNMCVDPKGRLIVSDQYGGLYRVTPPAVGTTGETKLEKIPVDIGEAQGLLWAFDSLYVVVNRGQKYESGLYRVRDTDGDDVLDKLETLRKLDGGGEHGPHAVLLTPDGKGLYIVCGNGTKLTDFSSSRVPQIWDEDNLLPRAYGRGFMKGKPAPGGYISRIDPDGKNWELIATGFRNEFDAALNADGELFTFDADMEWDLNTPWYRPTRVNHVRSGADFGWRNGGGKWPAHYPDSLGAVIDIGPGSPTGICFGYNAQFPAKYQRALFISDWSYGKLYAVHLKPEGASYSAAAEEFITGTPLPLTDVIVNEHDGAMYFAIGGRRVQSGLYRVTYAGSDSTATAELTDADGQDLRKTRKMLESLHGEGHENAVDKAWPYLSHKDRSIRYAARVALEHRPYKEWKNKLIVESDPQAVLTALLAAVRTYPRAEKPSGPELDTPAPSYPAAENPLQDDQYQLLGKLGLINLDLLSNEQRVDAARILNLIFIRLGPPDESVREVLVTQLTGYYPTGIQKIDSELVAQLVYLQAPDAAEKIVTQLEMAPTQEEQLDIAKNLRHLREGWTPELRGRFLKWCRQATGYRGGASFTLFVKNIFEGAIVNISEHEKNNLGELVKWAPIEQGPVVLRKDRPFVKEYTMSNLLQTVQSELKDRDYNRGRTMFAAANCFACHRFSGEGGAVGPDLTGLSGRFSPRDILESILDPSKQISDQYQAVTVVTLEGKVVTGRIVNLAGDSIRINTNMLDPNAQEGIDRKLIDEIVPSKVSMMPKGMLNTLNEDEVLDLMAFLLSRGDRNSPMFKK